MKKSSENFRQMQRERIMAVRPWENSTGAKTIQGKERSKMNALKMNIKFYVLLKEMKDLIKRQRGNWEMYKIEA